MQRPSELQEKFIQLVFGGMPRSRAYRIAYEPKPGTSEKVCDKRAAEIYDSLIVQKRLAELHQPLAEECKIKANDILQNWLDIATADPNDLVQHRRVCCRYCHGVGHQYQWTEKEYAHTAALFLSQPEDKKKKRGAPTAEEKLIPKKMPEKLGGFGFLHNREPHPNCPDCAGEGHGCVYYQDSRTLQGKAKALYAGVKLTAGGSIEILLRDQDAALENIAKFLGMFKLNLQGDAEKPLIPAGAAEKFKGITAEEASRVYQDLMRGEKK
jgi:phage terminase small subunit